MEPVRITIIAIMAYVILGLAPLLESGQLVLPYTLFKPTFLLILIVGIIVQKKKMQFAESVAFVWTGGLLLTSKFVFDIFWNRELTDNEFNFYYSLRDYTNLATYVSLLLWMLLIAWKENSKLSVIQVIGAIGLFVCLMSNELTWIILPTLVWYSGMFLQKNRKTVNYALAVFLMFTIVSVWLSAYFFGIDAVLIQV